MIWYIQNKQKTTSKSFEYKTKIIGSTPANNNILDTEIVFPWKFLSNYWISLDFPWLTVK